MYGWNCGMACHGRVGFSIGYGFVRQWAPERAFSQLSEAELLKQYKERLELKRKDIEAEIKAVEDRIRKSEK